MTKRDQFRLKMGAMGICVKENLIQDIYDILYPEGAEDDPWSPDTMQALERVFIRNGLHPEAKASSDGR